MLERSPEEIFFRDSAWELLLQLHRETDEKVKEKFTKPPFTMLVALSALKMVLGKSFQEMYDDGGLIPAILLYAAWAEEWDDYHDKGDMTKDDFEKTHQMALERIKDPLLRQKADRVVKEYREAEEKLCDSKHFESLGLGEIFTETVNLREASFGQFAQVLTEVVCVNDWQSDKCQDVAKQMSSFAIATSVLDDWKDTSQDIEAGRMTIGIAGYLIDHALRQEEGKTASGFVGCLLKDLKHPGLHELATNQFDIALKLEGDC
jgi:hypothetical protein